MSNEDLRNDMMSLIGEFHDLTEVLNNFHNDYDSHQIYQENIDSIDKIKKQLHEITDQYFRDISTSYINIL